MDFKYNYVNTGKAGEGGEAASLRCDTRYHSLETHVEMQQSSGTQNSTSELKTFKSL